MCIHIHVRRFRRLRFHSNEREDIDIYKDTFSSLGTLGEKSFARVEARDKGGGSRRGCPFGQVRRARL